MIALFAFAPAAAAFEPVFAIDDGFSIPMLSGGVETSLHAPGAETLLDGYGAALGYTTPFGMSDLSITTVHAAADFGFWGVSATYSGSGFDLYGDECEKAGFAVHPLGWLHCGGRITRYALRIEGFGDASTVTGDAGFVLTPYRSIVIAGVWEDLANAELGESKEPIDGCRRFSVGYDAGDGVTLLCGYRDAGRFEPSYYGGAVAHMGGQLDLGACGCSEPDRLEFMARLHIRGMTGAYRGSYHRELGMTHGFVLSCQCTRNR